MLSISIFEVVRNSDIKSFLIAKKHVYKPHILALIRRACIELAEVSQMGLEHNVAIAHSNDVTGQYYLSLNPTSEEYYFGTTISCYFKEKDELTSLSNGQSVTVQGTMQEMTLGIVPMKDCKVVK